MSVGRTPCRRSKTGTPAAARSCLMDEGKSARFTRRMISPCCAANALALLRARRERPRSSRAAEQRDEIASSHVGHGGVLPHFVPTKHIQGITELTTGPWATPEMF